MKKILVVNVNWVGDVIFSTPVFKAIKKAYPQAHLTCLGVPRIKDILECSPGVDEIIVYDEKGVHCSPRGKMALVSLLRKKKFDIAFLLHGSFTRALLLYLAGIPERVGYDTKKRGFLLTHKIELLPEWPHRSNFYLNVVESFGISVEDRVCELRVPQKSTIEVEKLLKLKDVSLGDFLVVVNTGGNWNLKRWPKEKFALLISKLIRELNARVVIPGAKKDVELVDEIVELSGVDPINLAGKTNLKQLIALLKRAHVVISADSGPLHIADSVGTRCVGLFGPTKPDITGPRGEGSPIIIHSSVGCNEAPCYFLECPDNICMKAITVEEVFYEVQKIKNT